MDRAGYIPAQILSVALLLKNSFLVVTYILALHVALALILWKSNFLPLLAQRLGLEGYDSPASTLFDQMLNIHARMDAQAPDDAIIFIGDSITQSLVVSNVVSPSLNYGIANDSTAGVLQRLVQYASLQRAKAIVIAVGINDLKFLGIDEILANYLQISRTLPQDIPLIFSAVLPVDETAISDPQRRNMQRIDELNAALKKWASTRPEIFVADSPASLRDEDGDLAAQFHIGDGIHLNAAGYAVWSQSLADALHAATKPTDNI